MMRIFNMQTDSMLGNCLKTEESNQQGNFKK